MIGVMPVKLDHAVEEKILLVKAVYEVLEEEARNYPFVCQAGCADCCTVNLQATSAEARYFLKGLSPEEKKALHARLKPLRTETRLRPRVTPNEMAALYMAGKEPPEEGEFVFKTCPFLGEDRLCTIYERRPFGCRSVFSLKPCREQGTAEVPPEFFSLITVLMQLLEEIDLAGLYGNFLDLLLFLLEAEGRSPEEIVVPEELLSNREVPDFALPPDHEEYVRGVLARLYRRQVTPEKTFKALLDEIKEGAQVKEALSFLGEAL